MEIRHPRTPGPHRDGMRCASCGERSIHRYCDACSQHPKPDERPEPDDQQEPPRD